MAQRTRTCSRAAVLLTAAALVGFVSATRGEEPTRTHREWELLVSQLDCGSQCSGNAFAVNYGSVRTRADFLTSSRPERVNGFETLPFRI